MTRDNNTFSLDLAPGTYTAEISSELSLKHDKITIVVGDSDIIAPAIAILVCDFDKDTYITSSDFIPLYKKISGSDLRYDVDGDGYITSSDMIPMYSCISATYSDVTIQ